MKVILANPPFETLASVGSSRGLRLVLNIIPPLGLAYLAAVLEQQGIDTQVFDFTVERNHVKVIQEITAGQPDIIGITASTPTFASARVLAGELKKNCPRALLVLGGAHVTAIPQTAMENSGFDVLVPNKIGVSPEPPEEYLRILREEIDPVGMVLGK